tara:strand:- start:8620 stop:9072 length:453 start_codon:yes stop_codon:yes gene_type:complete
MFLMLQIGLVSNSYAVDCTVYLSVGDNSCNFSTAPEVVESARANLEKIFLAKGYRLVSDEAGADFRASYFLYYGHGCYNFGSKPDPSFFPSISEAAYTFSVQKKNGEFQAVDHISGSSLGLLTKRENSRRRASRRLLRKIDESVEVCGFK